MLFLKGKSCLNLLLMWHKIQGHPIVRQCLRKLFDKEKIFSAELRREMISGPFPVILNKVAMLSHLTHKHGIVQIKVMSVHIEKAATLL